MYLEIVGDDTQHNKRGCYCAIDYQGVVVGINTSPLIHEGLPIFKIASLLAIIFAHLVFLYAAFFLLGVGASGQSISFATVSDHFKKEFVYLQPS